MKVSINYDVINNDKARDAFFAATTFTVEKGETVGVVCLNVPLFRQFVGRKIGEVFYVSEVFVPGVF